MMLRRRPISSSHEDFFIERYEWLLSVALHLTGHDRGRAEDLVHDAFIRFTLTHPDPQSIQNLDGYLYTLLRNLSFAKTQSGLYFQLLPQAARRS
jgi:DNA-directed RNA polymerase specialized sigma24 family protein